MKAYLNPNGAKTLSKKNTLANDLLYIGFKNTVPFCP
jgi:hypothetical protein